MKEKANPDYSQSAVNLTNPPQVIELMERRAKAREELDAKQRELERTSIYQERDDLDEIVQDLEAEIKVAIEAHGSYQDIEQGRYALKQRRETVTYLPERVKLFLPDFVKAIIEEVVNKQKVSGLLKGGLITEEQAKAISETAESFAFIIR